MAYSDRILRLAGLVEITLPGDTIRLCDGGQAIWGADTYRAKDPDYGMLGALDAITEKVDDQAPGGTLTFKPASMAAAALLADPGNQFSPVRFWIVQVDNATGEVIDGSDELLADMLIDTAEIEFGAGAPTLSLGLVSVADRLMTVNEGNVLSDSNHQSIWPGETGLLNATDAQITVAWRVASPPRGSVSGGGWGNAGGSGGGGGAQLDPMMPGGWRQN